MTFQAANGLTADGVVADDDLGQADRPAPARQHGRGGQGRPARAQRQAPGRADRQRHLRHRDPQRGHRLPEAHRHDAARQRRAGHLAEPHLALRLPVVQRGQEPVRLQRRQRQGELGDGRGDRPARGGGDGVRGKRPRAASSVGDVSFEHGGNIPGHQTHERGLDVDIRPIRDADNQCTWGTNWRFVVLRPGRDPALIDMIRADRAGPRQAHLLQRPGAHPRGPDDVVRRPRRPPAHPLLRAVLPGRGVPLLRRLAGVRVAAAPVP